MRFSTTTKYSLAGAGLGLSLLLGGCVTVDDTVEVTETVAATADDTGEDVAETVDQVVEMVEEKVELVEEVKAEMTAVDKLAAALDAQPDEAKARYGARNPAETLAFFEIEPGMKVAEALPGGGWYTKILLPYIGSEGKVVGWHYPDELWSLFGFGEEWAAARVERTAKWPEQAAEWASEDSAKIGSMTMNSMPDEMVGKLDAVLFIRALHNLNRFDEQGDFMTLTLAETYAALKPGGIVGVVQHRAPEANSDEWANGSNGYLKQDHVIEVFEAAGFELVETSEINANPKDVPSEEEFVWRLPPVLNGTEEGTPEREAYVAIGESDRMTLKFRKPS